MGHLVGQRILLREYMVEDIPYARAWANDVEVTKMLSHTFLGPQTYDMTERYFNGILGGQAGGYHYVIAHKENQEYIGQIDLFNVQQVDRTAELGMVIGAAGDRGRGYGKEALGLLLRFAFLRANLRRIHLQVFPENTGAVRCYEANGFVREGLWRGHCYYEGEYRDLMLMGVLREEWEARFG